MSESTYADMLVGLCAYYGGSAPRNRLHDSRSGNVSYTSAALSRNRSTLAPERRYMTQSLRTTLRASRKKRQCYRLKAVGFLLDVNSEMSAKDAMRKFEGDNDCIHV